MRRFRRLAVLCATGALLLSACGEDPPEEDPPPIGGEEPNEPDEPDPEPVDEDTDEDDEAEEPEDPYAVPDDPGDIDEDYAKLVIDTLLEIQTEALITALSQERGPLDAEATRQLISSSDGRNLESSLEDFQRYAQEIETPDGLLPPEQMSASQVQPVRVLHVEPERCLVLAGWWDQRTTATNPVSEDERSVFSLSRADPESVEVDINPTPWVMRHIVFLQDGEGEQIPEQDWDEMEYGDTLDHTCEGLE